MAILEGAEHLHRRVYRTIAEEIANGVLPVGGRLPSERELSERLAVSRATVRRALAELGNDGLVESYAGRGTFVSAGPIGEAPNTLQSFSEVGASRGLRASAKVLQARVRPADLDEGEALGVVAGADVFELERVRMLDGLPVSIDHSRVPLARAPSLVDIDFRKASLYEVLDDAGAGPVKAEYTIGAIRADKRHERFLGVEPGSPLLQTTTKSFDEVGRLVELGEMVYRCDRYRFRTTLTRRRR